ncbi:hypothetical protein RN001_003411 [Aquatica leii]|uniref:Uncharacterized protein n=1 Tax=Aquatica leii TaxID=1421715 RepID=A0AAN7PF05_9COLE|nr:hypothetical protein RN001_003411 [Aquatica leii]
MGREMSKFTAFVGSGGRDGFLKYSGFSRAFGAPMGDDINISSKLERLQENMENYIRFKLLGGNFFLKSGVIPHIFDCQPDRKRAASAPERSLSLKMKRRRLMEEVLISTKISSKEDLDRPSTSSPVVGSETDEHVFTVCDENVKSVGVQVKPLYRSKYVSCNIQAKVCDTASSPGKFFVMKEAATLPIKGFSVSTTKRSDCNRKIPFYLPSTSSGNGFESCSSYIVSESSVVEAKVLLEDKKKLQEQALNVTRRLIAKKPKSYLGVPDSWFPHLLNLICTKTKLNYDHIMLTLMKIKLNDSFFRLGD